LDIRCNLEYRMSNCATRTTGRAIAIATPVKAKGARSKYCRKTMRVEKAIERVQVRLLQKYKPRQRLKKWKTQIRSSSVL
jgi:hypothetical protein